MERRWAALLLFVSVGLTGCFSSSSSGDGAAPPDGGTSGQPPTDSGSGPPPADITPPASPASISAVASSATTVNVSWQAPLDNVGVTGYRVLRCSGSGCTPATEVATPTGTSYGDSGLSANTAYRYTVAARDAAGNWSTPSGMATATTPANPAPTGASFSARCTAPGVVLCEGFDDASKFTPAVWPASGLYPAGDGRILGSQDTTIKASGTGALKFAGLAAHQNVSGQWTQLTPQVFGQNSTFYVQYRYRVSPEMLQGSGGGRKLAIFHYGSKTCADLEITTQHTYYRGFPQMYTDCGGQTVQRTSGSTIYLQQGADPFPTGAGWNCPYTSPSAGAYPADKCGMFRANTWLTLYYRVDVGTWGSANSRIQAWMAHDGEALKQFINVSGFRINNSSAPGVDHVTLLPYDTGATTAPGGAVWYDELIVATQPIAAPSGVAAISGVPDGSTTPDTPPTGTTGDTTAPSTPAGLSAAATSATSVNLAWSAATDNVAVTGYQVFRCAGAGCTPGTQVGSTTTASYADTGLSPSTAYRYRVAALDAAGNQSARSTVADVTTPSVPAPQQGDNGAIPTASGWYQFPNTTVNAVCAATNGFPQVNGTTGCAGIFAWSGGALDTRRNRLIVFGGGHRDYYGNELYALDINNMTMSRLTNPGLPIATSCQESIAGGSQPNSRHTYDGIEYIPAVDRLFIFSGSLACNDGWAGNDTWLYDFTGQRWERKNATGPVGEMGILTAQDGGFVYLHDRRYLYRYDPVADRYTQLSTRSAALGYHLMATIDSKRKLFVIVGWDQNWQAGRVTTFPLAGGEASDITTTGGNAIVSQKYVGLEYDPVRDRVVAWNGGNTVYSLNMDTRQWTTRTFNSSPGAPALDLGTLGRFRYSPASDAFILVNAHNQDAYAFRP